MKDTAAGGIHATHGTFSSCKQSNTGFVLIRLLIDNLAPHSSESNFLIIVSF